MPLCAGSRRAARQLFHRLAQNAPESPRVVRDDQTHQPIDECGREHKRHETWLGPAIKGVAGQNEPAVPPPLGRADEGAVAEQRERQEVVDKNVRTKNHASRWIVRSTARCQRMSRKISGAYKTVSNPAGARLG